MNMLGVSILAFTIEIRNPTTMMERPAMPVMLGASMLASSVSYTHLTLPTKRIV